MFQCVVLFFQGKLNIKKEISEDQLLYYNNITKAIISGNEETIKV